MADHTKTLKIPLARKLLAWYRRHKRTLPWRDTNDPYAIWVSEIMLQQTQVDTVIPYYLRFLEAFPTVASLARAPQADVLKAWENLGYYSRARNLHTAARQVIQQCEGRVPDQPAELRKLPGIGAYTAGAIASIAYGRRFPAVDGNVRRILCRLFAIQKPMDDTANIREMEMIATGLVPARNPGDFNSALMDLGATICRPKAPRCEACPLATHCGALALHLENDLPVVKKRKKIPHRHAAAAVIHNRKGQLLMVQRPDHGLLASLWKLPGGFLDKKTDLQMRLPDQIKAELGIQIRADITRASVDHAYTHFRVTLHACTCTLVRGNPKAVGCARWRWVTPDDVATLPLSKADRMILDALSFRPERKTG
ncbi:MAG: A/G-specific adenine glycosylase [Smithellaceae bacterium]